MPPDSRKGPLGLLALLAVLLIAGTLALDFFVSQSVARDRASLTALDRETETLKVALADLRAAEAAYVGTGQGPDLWIRQATDLLARIETGLTRLRDSSPVEADRSGYDAALALLANLATLDKKAQQYVRDDQKFLAADVVFIEGLENNLRLSADLDRLRAARTASVEQALAQTSWLRLGGTALAMVLVLGVALRVGRPAPLSPASEAALTAQMIRDLPPPVKPATPLSRTAGAPAPPPAQAPAPAPPPLPAPVVNLPEAAELCVDLARVMDSRDVPALLERAARVLDAKGVIVWVIDSAGGALHPSLSHGYPDKVLSRLGTLEVDADNVTSLAFRSVRPQIMAGTSPGAAGAVAVPLVTAAGCSGVLAAELRESKPAPELLALTRIVAAQFATLIGPAELSGARAAEA